MRMKLAARYASASFRFGRALSLPYRALFLSNPTAHEELAHCLQYGVVPIAPEVKELDDYNPVQETGNSFLFEQPTVWNAFAALVRAIETYKFPFDWRTIQRHGMESKGN